MNLYPASYLLWFYDYVDGVIDTQAILITSVLISLTGLLRGMEKKMSC